MFHLIVLAVGLVCGTLLTRETALILMLISISAVLLDVVLYRRFSISLFKLRSRTHCGVMVLLWWLAVLYGHAWLSWQLQHRLALEQGSLVVQVDGRIDHVQVTELGQRITLRVANIQGQPELTRWPRRVQLNHYRRGANHDVMFATGDEVQLQAVLRSPRNFANGLPFDYEAFLLTQAIDATGYVQAIVRKQSTQTERWRQRWLVHLQTHRDEDAWPWIAGLVFAEQGAFSDDMWQLTQVSGTVHLLVVSGLHVGWVALLGIVFGRYAARVYAVINVRTPPCVWCWSMLGLMLALAAYWSVAQAGVSLQRASWMLLFAALYTLWLRRVSPSLILLTAVVVMLLFNPLLYTRTGFVFSVLAVWAILQFFQGRRSGWLGVLWWPQWVVFAALMPVMLWWQNPVNVGHLLANAVAIPWLTFVMLPLTFLHTLFDVSWLADAVRWNAQGFLRSQHAFQTISWPALGWQSSWVLLLWWLWLWLLTRGVSFWLSILGSVLIMVVWWRSSVYPLPFSSPTLTLVDVGQGLSLMATGSRWSDHQRQALIYDTGPRFSSRFDAGSGMLVPLLQRQRVQSLHSLIISHNHADHYGGAASLVAAIPVERLWQGQPLRSSLLNADKSPKAWQSCHTQTAWYVLSSDWRYRFFPISQDRRSRTNNYSCVMLLEWQGIRVLLMGDLERDAELWLAAHYGNALRAELLIVGHHGSRTSTTDALLTAVKPKQAWISAGFNNRFQHPHDDVIARLERHGIEWYSTANEGALTLLPDGRIQRQRQLPSAPWRQR